MKSLILIALLVIPAAFCDLESMRARVPKIVELKEKGFIGEQVDGFLGVVKSSDEAEKVVREENADRREEYAKRARSQSKSLDEFIRGMGELRVDQEKPGRFVRPASGSWTKK